MRGCIGVYWPISSGGIIPTITKTGNKSKASEGFGFLCAVSKVIDAPLLTHSQSRKHPPPLSAVQLIHEVYSPLEVALALSCVKNARCPQKCEAVNFGRKRAPSPLVNRKIYFIKTHSSNVKWIHSHLIIFLREKTYFENIQSYSHDYSVWKRSLYLEFE